MRVLQETAKGDFVEDIVILAIGRTLIELSAQKEQLLQALKQEQAKNQPQAPAPSVPEVESD